MKKILLTGGRAPATLHLARLFHAAGHTVYVAESLPQHLCQGSRAVARCFNLPEPNLDSEGFVAGLAAIVREYAVDLLIPTCEEVFHVARAAARVPCEVFAPAWPTLRRLHSKWDFVQDLTMRGVPTPDTWLAHSDAALAEILARLPREQRVVLKPVYSRFGTHVRMQTAGEAAPLVGASHAAPWVVQVFVEGRALCTYSLAREGQLMAHAAYAPAFTTGANASIYFTPCEHPGMQRWVEEFVRADGLTGQLAFDFIEASDGVLYPLECNPRATSGALLFGEADRLDRAFLPWSPAGQAGTVVVPRSEVRAMMGLPMWLYGLPPALQAGPEGLAHWARAVAAAQDAIFRWDDPVPGLKAVLMLGEFWSRAQRSGTTVLAASTLDIEWNGEA